MTRACPNCGQPTMPVYSHQNTERGGWRCAPTHKETPTDHVAILEKVNADGSISTIEGNGPSETHVARSVRQPSEITGFGDVNQLPRQTQPVPYVPFEDPICAVKPWVCEGWEG